MDMKEAMKERHMVRKYKNKPLTDDVIEKLKIKIKKNNREYKLNMKLMVNNDKGLSTLIKDFLSKGVSNYIILAGKDSKDLDERLGYSGTDIMLYAQTLGLNTWWVGGTYNASISKYVKDKKVIGIIAVGYGRTNGVPHKSKSLEEVSIYEGTPPKWFDEGVKAALLAPTALNRQDFVIIGRGNNVTIKCDNGIFTGANIGIIKYHFELGAEKKDFKWI